MGRKMGQMRIRDYRPSDAPVLAEIYARSVRGIGPRFYAPEQVEAWAAQAPTVERVRGPMATAASP
jgi:putative acetyltransferase